MSSPEKTSGNNLSSGNKKAILYLHTAVFLFGGAGLAGKFISLHPVIIVFGRTFFASSFLFIFLLLMKTRIKLNGRTDYFNSIISGGLLALHWITFFISVHLSGVAVALFTFALFPVFTVILAHFYVGEKIKLPNVFSAFIALVGVFFILPDFNFSQSSSSGIISGIFSAFSFAVLTLLNKKFSASYSPLLVSFYQNLWAAVFLSPFLFIIQSVFTSGDIILLVLLGTLLTAVAHSLFISALTSVKTHTASVAVCLEPVYGILFAIILTGELPSLRTIAGGIIILFTAFYTSITKNE